MRAIAETPNHDRYLMVAERISANVWRSLCERVRDHVAKASDRDVVTDPLKLIEPNLPPTSFPFVVLSSYADIPADTKWNIAFDPAKPSSIEPTTAVLQFGILWQRIALPSLEHGHHQVAVIDFPDGIPTLLQSLPIDANRQTYDYIGLCDAKDLRAIQARHEIVAEQSSEPEHSTTRQLES